MAAKPLPSQEVLRQLLRYEPETGKLFWRERESRWFKDGDGRYTASRNAKAWNSQFAGTEAFCLDIGLGYLKGHLLGHRVYAHRVIWTLQTGVWPEHDIDHINGDRADNRWGNLRAVNRLTNAHNAKRRNTNSSGMMGVSWHPVLKKWRAGIMVDGRRIALGCHEDFDDACAARKSAERRYGFHENYGRVA